MTDLHTLPGHALTQLLRRREISAMEITRAALARIERENPRVNAFTDVTAEHALQDAAEVDARLARGDDPGRLAGVPFAAKNLFDIAGIPTRAGSLIGRGNAPAAQDAAAVASLRREGAICLGALNMDEYAYGFTTENAHDGAVHNPHDLSRNTGGSSGGSGAALAAGLAAITLGTDTNGSIRVPASANGVFGLKPTYGRLSRRGCFPLANSLDHVGPLARSVRDLAAAYDAMQGADESDPAQARRAIEPVGDAWPGPKGLRMARLVGYFARNGMPAAQQATQRVAEALGAHEEVEMPDAAAARAAAYLITAAEGGQVHLPNLRRRAEEFSPLSRDRLIAGALLPAQWVLHAQRIRAHVRDRMRDLFRRFDILLAPAMPFAATGLGQDKVEIDGDTLPLRPIIGVYTQPISFIGLPVLAVPMQNADGALPIGVQLIAPPWREDVLFRAAAFLENAGICTAPVAPSFA